MPVWKTALAVFALDVLTKSAALDGLTLFKPVVVVPHFFNMSLVFNRGAAFGMLPGGAPLFMLLAAGTVLGILFFARKSAHTPPTVQIALGLIAGGAAGNFLDRLRFGFVVDFLDFYWGAWHWPAFNIADASLCVGAGCLAFWTLRKNPNMA